MAGVAAAIFLYYRDKRLSETTKGTRFLLAFIRFLGISLLSFLLLNPYLSSKKEQTEYPSIIFLQDNSTSILAHEDSSSFKNEFDKNFELLKNSFQDNYQFRSFAFGEDIQETEDYRFTEKKTDIAAAFRNIDLQFSNQHIGAIILASDGAIGAISFDYGFYSDEKMFQWGKEKWNLAKDGEKWLITDVVFSIHFPNIEPFPFK